MALRKIGFEKDSSGKTIYPPHYFRWRNMRGRCLYPSTTEYKRYGARGIYVCEEWNDFLSFQEWCFATYQDGKTLD
jgi:hypothetical protein